MAHWAFWFQRQTRQTFSRLSIAMLSATLLCSPPTMESDAAGLENLKNCPFARSGSPAAMG
jgi:hypothetical protein